MSLHKYIILPCSGLEKCGDIQCYEAKDLHPKKSFNTEEKNTIRKIKGNGLEVSLQIRMNLRMTPIPQEVHKQTTKKIVTYYRHCKAWTLRTSVERFH
jgi:hypothetical protein